MTIYDEILSELKKMYRDGATYQEMSDKMDISYSHLRGIANGDRDVKGMSLEVLFKMFPNAKITLNGNTGNVATGGVAVAGNGNNFFSDSDSRMKKLEEAVMSSDLPAEAKVKVYQMIKETK